MEEKKENQQDKASQAGDALARHRKSAPWTAGFAAIGGVVLGWIGSVMGNAINGMLHAPKILQAMAREHNVPAEYLIQDGKALAEFESRMLRTPSFRQARVLCNIGLPLAGAGLAAAHTALKHEKKSEALEAEIASWAGKETAREHAAEMRGAVRE